MKVMDKLSLSKGEVRLAIIKFIAQAHPTAKGRYATLKKMIDYIANPKKTDDRRLVGSQNCFCRTTDEVLNAMIQTKEFYGKTSDNEKDRMGYHFSISWSPEDEEITYEKAMEVTKEFCEEYLNGYECEYAVHNDRDHIHSHIVFNSVNAMTGLKYHYDNYDWGKEVQPILDKICKRNGLKTLEEDTGMSIDEYLKEQRKRAWCKKKGYRYRGKIDENGNVRPVGNNKSYHNEKDERYSHSQFVKDYIDSIVLEVNSIDEFFERMRADGFYVRMGKSEKHGDYFAVRGKGMDRAKRNYTFGYNYTMEKLCERIEMKNKPLPVYPVVEDTFYIFRYTYWRKMPKKINKAQRRLYYGLYQEGLRKRGIQPDYRAYRESARKLEEACRQLDLVTERQINTKEKADEVIDETQEKIGQLKQERKMFYINRKPYMEMVNLYKKKKKLAPYVNWEGTKEEIQKEYDDCIRELEKYGHTDKEIESFIEEYKKKLKELNKKIKSEDTVLSDIQNLKAMYMIDDTEEQKYDYEIPESYGMEENAERKRGQNQII